MVTGHIVINTVTDAGMLVIFEACKQQKGLRFQNQAKMQAQNQGTPSTQIFNNVVLAWEGPEGLNTLAATIHKLATTRPWVPAFVGTTVFCDRGWLGGVELQARLTIGDDEFRCARPILRNCEWSPRRCTQAGICDRGGSRPAPGCRERDRGVAWAGGAT